MHNRVPIFPCVSGGVPSFLQRIPTPLACGWKSHRGWQILMQKGKPLEAPPLMNIDFPQYVHSLRRLKRCEEVGAILKPYSTGIGFGRVLPDDVAPTWQRIQKWRDIAPMPITHQAYTDSFLAIYTHQADYSNTRRTTNLKAMATNIHLTSPIK